MTEKHSDHSGTRPEYLGDYDRFAMPQQIIDALRMHDDEAGWHLADDIEKIDRFIMAKESITIPAADFARKLNLQIDEYESQVSRSDATAVVRSLAKVRALLREQASAEGQVLIAELNDILEAYPYLFHVIYNNGETQPLVKIWMFIDGGAQVSFYDTNRGDRDERRIRACVIDRAE